MRPTPEYAIPHCLRFAGKDWDTEPINIDIGGKTDDSEGDEYGELEEDPRLRFRSSFMPLLLNFFVEIDAASLVATRLPVSRPLNHPVRIGARFGLSYADQWMWGAATTITRRVG